MGVFTYEHEFTSTISPHRLFKAFILDGDNLIPKLAPQAVKHVEILEGHGGVGTIKKVHFAEGSKFKHVKQKVDAIDHEHFIYKHSLIEGDILLGKFEKISYETKFVLSPDGGTIIKTSIHYHTIGHVDVDKAHVDEGKEQAAALLKIVEGYLHANPDAYN